ncbi:hypothetical protein ACFWJ4_22550 [Kitasatospora sp. NPDC127067]|uniref:hypothetical protein n=1 Tax=Kitasatospora sp. NPDC127067 TaxID=3347126 RepID=UPI00365DD43A
MLQRDPDPGGHGEGHVLDLLTPTRRLGPGIAEEETDAATALGLAPQGLEEGGLLQPDEVVGVPGEEDLGPRLGDQLRQTD